MLLRARFSDRHRLSQHASRVRAERGGRVRCARGRRPADHGPLSRGWVEGRLCTRAPRIRLDARGYGQLPRPAAALGTLGVRHKAANPAQAGRRAAAPRARGHVRARALLPVWAWDRAWCRIAGVHAGQRQ